MQISGAETFATRRSVLSAARKRGWNLLKTLSTTPVYAQRSAPDWTAEIDVLSAGRRTADGPGRATDGGPHQR